MQCVLLLLGITALIYFGLSSRFEERAQRARYVEYLRNKDLDDVNERIDAAIAATYELKARQRCQEKIQQILIRKNVHEIKIKKELDLIEIYKDIDFTLQYDTRAIVVGENFLFIGPPVRILLGNPVLVTIKVGVPEVNTPPVRFATCEYNATSAMVNFINIEHGEDYDSMADQMSVRVQGMLSTTLESSARFFEDKDADVAIYSNRPSYKR